MMPSGDAPAAQDARNAAAALRPTAAGIDGRVMNSQTKVERRQRHDGEEGAAPADILAEEAAQRRGDGGRQRVAAVQERRAPAAPRLRAPAA